MRNPLATHPKPTHTDAHASTGRKGGREEERERVPSSRDCCPS